MTLSIQERLALVTESHEGSLWQWACMLRCAMPGIVTAVDLTKGTCTVQPAIQEMVLQPPPATPQSPNAGTTQNIPVSTTIKPVQDVPMVMMRAGNYVITLPVEVGTECLLIFADMCIDGWWANGGVNAQYDRRRHDLSDAFALFGPWSQPNNITNHSSTNLEIRSLDGTKSISIGAGGINFTGPGIQAFNGGTSQFLVTAAWLTWFTTHIYPFLTGLGYAGPAAPTNSATVIFEAQ